MIGYTKLFQSIITSTIWQEPNNCRVLWITMLALKNSKQICDATIPALANLSNIPIEECEKYLIKFQSPDPYSRSEAFEGRRIEKVDGGWLILNGELYSRKMNEDERRQYKTIKQREYRNVDKLVDNCGQKRTLWTYTDTDTDTETNICSNIITTNTQTSNDFKNKTSRLANDSLRQNLEETFLEFWKLYPKKLNKDYAFKVWKKLKPDLELFKKILISLEKFKKTEDWIKENGKYIPYASSWLNGKRWEDEIKEEKEVKPEANIIFNPQPFLD